MNKALRKDRVATLSTSVAMATYNGASYLQQQLDSLAAQDRLPDELVISDDCSSDGTAGIVEAFAASAPFPVRFFPNAHRLGVRDNFQRALSLSKGEIIFMSDQDDVWFPAKVDRVVELLEQNPHVLVAMNDKIITDEQLHPTGATMLSNIRNYGASSSLFVAGCCSAIRRPWLDVTLPIPDDIAYHDVWILGLAHDLGVVSLLEEPLQYYRRHGSNVSQGPYSATRKLTLKDRAQAEFASLLQKKLDAQKAQWQVDRHWAIAKAERLRDCADRLATLGLADTAASVEAKMKRREALIEERQALASLDWIRRTVGGLGLWRRGGYAEFAGWKSLVKDLTLR